jgi:O-antigen ligase
MDSIANGKHIDGNVVIEPLRISPVAGMIVVLILALYMVYPREEGIKTFGIGPEGGRVLLLDFFVGSLLLFAASRYKPTARIVIDATSRLGWILFWTTLTFSVLRGYPLYGGWALGESRWFVCSILVPVGYLLYEKDFFERIRKLLVFLALVQSVLAAYQILSGEAWDVSDAFMRFAGGREGLVIALGILVLVDDLFNMPRTATKRPVKTLLLCYFAITLIVIQTRSLYVFLPIVLLVYAIATKKLNGKSAIRRLGAVAISVALLFGLAQFVLPEKVSESINSSISVAFEGFSSKTFAALSDPAEVGQGIAEEFSRGGNTAFRLLAWSQVIVAIDETPHGWWIGMPMGAGFSFIDPSGFRYENLEPHNDYLAIISKIGILGFLGYILVVGSYVARVFRHAKLYTPSDSALLVVVVLLISLFSSLNAEMRTYGTHFWMWFFLGMGIRAVDVEKSEEVRK